MSMIVYSDHLELRDPVPDKLFVAEYGPQGQKGNQGLKGDTGEIGPQGPPGPDISDKLGTTLGTTTVDLVTGNLVVAFSTPWGIDNTGAPYYNSGGATIGEEAVLVVGVDGSLNIVKPGG